jgi:HlyD family secretion protein
MKKTGIIILGVIIGLVLIITILYLVKKSTPNKEVFETKQAKISNIVQKTMAVGSVVPRNEIQVKPQVNGIIDEVYVEPGTMIKKGDMIAKVKIIPNMIELNNAEARVKSAGLNYNNAQTEFNRFKTLHEKKVIPETEYRQYLVEFENAKQELEFARDNLQLVKEGVKKMAQTSSNTIIRSTINGMVLDVPVEVGNSVIMTNSFNEGTTIAEVADMNEMVFEGKVDETEVGKLKEGMKLILTIGAIENVKFDAALEYISPKGTEENGAIQFEIRASIEPIDTVFIRAGYSANADIVLVKKDSVLNIPEALLSFENDSTFVEVEKELQVFEKRHIEIGLSDGVNVEVLAGITKEDKLKAGKIINNKKNVKK